MNYDDLPEHGTWWPYFNFADGIDSNLKLTKAMTAVKGLAAALYERYMWQNGNPGFAGNAYYERMKDAVAGKYSLIDPVIELRSIPFYLSELDRAIQGICTRYFNTDYDLDSIDIEDLKYYRNYHYTFDTLLEKACLILNTTPIPYMYDAMRKSMLTPMFLQEYALQRFVMINLLKICHCERAYYNDHVKTSSIIDATIEEFTHATPTEEEAYQVYDWYTLHDYNHHISSVQITRIYPFDYEIVDLFPIKGYEFYFIYFVSEGEDFGTGFSYGWNRRAIADGRKIGQFDFYRGIPPRPIGPEPEGSWHMTYNDCFFLFDISDCLYFYTDVENP